MAKLGSTTVTGNLSVSGTINGYKLAESARRGVDTAISSGSTSTNIPTTKAIVDYVNSAINSWNSSHKATLSVNGPTVTTSAGYYAASESKTVGNGAYSAAAGGSEATPVVVNTKATATGFAFASSGSYYITTDGTQSAGSVTATATAKIDKTGWLTTDNKTANASISTSATINTKKYYLPVGTISTGTSAKSGWTTNTSAVVPANGYLYIGAGYYPNTQISLATLIPDDSSLSNNAGNEHILSGYEAYDTDGNRLVGTITRLDRNDDNSAKDLNRHYNYKYSDGTTNKDYYTKTNTGFGNVGPGHLADTWYIKKGAFTYSSSTAANAAVVTVSTDGWFDKQTVCKIDSDGETLVITV